MQFILCQLYLNKGAKTNKQKGCLAFETWIYLVFLKGENFIKKERNIKQWRKEIETGAI